MADLYEECLSVEQTGNNWFVTESDKEKGIRISWIDYYPFGPVIKEVRGKDGKLMPMTESFEWGTAA